MAFTTQPIVSVIIPAYNEAHYIADCIEAILKQTVSPIEIIVIDNNSSDNTKEIALSYDLVTVIDEKEQGVTAARTAGFNAAKGELLAKIDADTIVDPTWLETMQQVFLKNSSLQAASGRFKNLEATPGPIQDISLYVSNLFVFKLQPSFGLFTMVFGSNLWITKVAWHEIRKHTNPANDIWEDLDIALTLAKFTNGNTYIHHDTLYSISARRLRASFKESLLYGLGGYRSLMQYSRWRALLLLVVTSIGALLSILIKLSLWFSKVEREPFGEEKEL